MSILNLTQHPSTPEQAAAGVIDITDPTLREQLVELLTFEELPTREALIYRAYRLVALTRQVMPDVSGVMIGGAPYLLPYIAYEFSEAGVKVLHAFTKRESVEQTLPDGSVRKTAVFRHVGFVEDGGVFDTAVAQ